MHIPPSSVAAGSATRAPHPSNDNVALWVVGRPGGYDESWNSLIGIVTAIVGNVLISFALNMQRYAHIRLDREWQEQERMRKKRNASQTGLAHLVQRGTRKKQTENLVGNAHVLDASEASPLLSANGEEPAIKQPSYLKSTYWWLGIILMTVGEAGNFLAYGFAPASIVSPLGVVALISNCIIAPFMLKEPFRKRDALGVVTAVGGAVTVVFSASDNNPKLGPDEIWDLIRRWEFETYLGITCAVIACLMVASNRFGEKNILIDLGLVGLFGGYTALSTKGVASLLSYTLWRVITFPVFYLLVAILAGTAIMQIKYINRALQRFDATQVIPVQFVLFTLSVILGSAILYRDFERTSGDHAGKFVGGCALTFAGVWLITSGRASRHNENDNREPEPEDAINLCAEPYFDANDNDEEEQEAETSSSTLRAPSPTKHFRPLTPTINLVPTSPPSQAPRTPAQDTKATTTTSSPSTSTPPISRHSSTPVLPSEVTSDLSSRPPSTPTHPPATDTFASITPPPPTTPNLRRLRTAERSTVGALGPLLASPLSTSLTAMVQDLKRGGTGGTGGTGVRRRESVLGIGGSELLGEPLDRRRTVEGLAGGQRRPGPGVNGRERSLSGTLNMLWKGVGGGGKDGTREEGREGNDDNDDEFWRRR